MICLVPDVSSFLCFWLVASVFKQPPCVLRWSSIQRRQAIGCLHPVRHELLWNLAKLLPSKGNKIRINGVVPIVRTEGMPTVIDGLIDTLSLMPYLINTKTVLPPPNQ